MNAAVALVAFIALQRATELALASANTRRLLASGAREAGRAHYPLIVVFHAIWLATAAAVALTPGATVATPWVGVFLVLQALRVWTIATLGRRWTTRIVVADAPPIRCGPYRWLRHPNYAVVALEIPVVMLALGRPALALGFGVVNAAVLALRIATEDAALGRRPG